MRADGSRLVGKTVIGVADTINISHKFRLTILYNFYFFFIAQHLLSRNILYNNSYISSILA